MGSLALAPLGYLLAGPIAEVVGGREVIGAGAALTLALLGLGLLPRQTRGLTRLGLPGGRSRALTPGRLFCRAGR